MAQQKQKRSTPKRKSRPTTHERIFESDGTYFLKLVVFTLLGTFWLRFAEPLAWGGIPVAGVPVGFFVGLLLVRKFEPYQQDRKIWYAILLVVTIICCFAPVGIVL